MKRIAMSRRSFLQAASAIAALSVAPSPILRKAAGQIGPKTDIGYTACDNCNGVPYCGIKFTTTDGVITSIESWGGEYPVDPICSKSYGAWQRVYNPNRLLYPMMRTNPKGAADPGWKRVTWDEAYRKIAYELNKIKAESGPDKVFFYVGDPKEPRTAVRRLSGAFGSINWGTESSTNCALTQGFANWLCAGTQILSVAPPAKNIKCCLIWGTNFVYSRAPSTKEVLNVMDEGCKFIVVDVRGTPTAAVYGDVFLQVRPAVTAALANGMANYIIQENLHDAEFCENWIHGWAEYKQYISQFTPEKTEEITWVPKEKMMEAARMFATIKPSIIMNSTQSTIHDRNATNNHRAMVMLYAITGQRPPFPGGRPPAGGVPGWVNMTANADSYCLYGNVKDKFTERLDYKYYPVWADYTVQVNTSHFPEYVFEEGVRGLVAFGINVMIWSQTKEYANAIQALDFSMGVDYFYRPHTHDLMDVILPAATCYERHAPIMNHGRAFFGRKPIPPLGQSKEDWMIADEIIKYLGLDEYTFGGDVEKVIDYHTVPIGFTYKELQAQLPGGITKDGAPPAAASDALGFPTPTGKIEAVSTRLEKAGLTALPEYVVPYQQTAEYPLLLVSGTRRPHMTHSKTRTDTPWLMELESLPYCDINPADAADRNLRTGDPLLMKSQWGEIRAYAKVTTILPKGVVGMVHGWTFANVNELMPREYDPISGYPTLKEIAIQVTRAEA